MTADVVATHLQTLYLLCGTAIPVFFVALAVQIPPSKQRVELSVDLGFPFGVSVGVEVPVGLQTLGLYGMLVGELAALAALLLDRSAIVLEVLAIGGVVVGALFVTLSVAQTQVPTHSSASEAESGREQGG
jgi:hypothetical protein